MRTFGYFILALMLFYFFLLVQFPYEAIKKNVAQNFAELNLGQIKIGQIGPAFPFDLHMRDVSWELENLGVQIPELILKINIFKIIGGKTEIEIRDLQSQARLQANYYHTGKEGGLKIRLNNSELKANYKNDYSLSLKLSGEGKLQWAGENYEKVNGEFWAALERGEMEVKAGGSLPFFLKAYDRLRAEVQIKDGDFRAKRLVISGKESKEIVLKDLNLGEFLKRPRLDIDALLRAGSDSIKNH